MWFRNLCVYQLADAFRIDAEQLEERLQTGAFQPVGGHDPESRGWVPPLPGGEPLVHVAGPRMMICLQTESRVLPPAVVRETVEERVSEREDAMGRPLGRREKARLKEEVTLDLLPRAFTRSKRCYAYIDLEARWLVVDATTWREGELLTDDLRALLGTLPIRPLQTDSAPGQVMTEWLARDHFPSDLEPGEEAVFEDPRSEGAEVRCKRQDLRSDEIRGLVRAGKRIRRLAVDWDGRINAVLDADLSIKRLKFTDLVQSDADEREAESAAERFDADFSIMSGELSRFLPRLQSWFD
ncbi:recombination-associated protein RdgC [Spiribacter salinus]|jgi:recombination associated protein RdgC|uniref:recombination-associated protein RdgC n=1 Tax=Spiribacter salinus TaxID=1335746 RepID=UPI001C97F192|nr:recombination-associated protein RdgC [Spiribacter salinus]MBY5269250.1 recombination-associated protein RdgC [Spiribacter salinus]